MTRYLEKYINIHIYNNRSLRDKVIFGFRVQNLNKFNGAWNMNGGNGALKTIRT